MKTKLIISSLVLGILLCSGTPAMANTYDKYLGRWKGKVEIYNSTCPSVYPDGDIGTAIIKIKSIQSTGKLTAYVKYSTYDYKYQLTGKINEDRIKFHYEMYDDVTTYDLSGKFKTDTKMRLHSFNNRPGTCDDGFNQRYILKKL
ncbi:MAG: hypothetical protein WC752_01035 [Patescibacteria group bacterium]|jgi:hypothetical protein